MAKKKTVIEVDIKEEFDRLHNKLDSISNDLTETKIQTTKTNGSVKTLKTVIVGLSTAVLTMAGWIYSHVNGT